MRSVAETVQKVEGLPTALDHLQKEVTDMASVALADTDTYISEMQEKILFHTMTMYMEFCVYLQMRANDSAERKQVILEDLSHVTDQANKVHAVGIHLYVHIYIKFTRA